SAQQAAYALCHLEQSRLAEGPYSNGGPISDPTHCRTRANRSRVNASEAGEFMVWRQLDTRDIQPYTSADEKAGRIPKGKKVGELPLEFYARQGDLMMALDRVMRSDLPGLERFYRRWGLRFPIPPNVGIVLDEIMDDPWTRSVKI